MVGTSQKIIYLWFNRFRYMRETTTVEPKWKKVGETRSDLAWTQIINVFTTYHCKIQRTLFDIISRRGKLHYLRNDHPLFEGHPCAVTRPSKPEDLVGLVVHRRYA